MSRQNFEVWQQTFDDLREKQSVHAGAVQRARADHEAAVRSGDVDLIVRSNEALRGATARLDVITDLINRHRATREAALALDRKAELAELVAEHQPLKAEGVEALERVLAALKVFSAEVDEFAATVTKVQNSARQCGQLPAIRIGLDQQKRLNQIHRTKDLLLVTVSQASSSLS